MSNSMVDKLAAVALTPQKCELRGTSESFVRGGQLFDEARQACAWSHKEAAGHYGVSESLLSRQRDHTDNQHLSFQRICEMPAAFQREIGLRLLRGIGVLEEEYIFRVRKIA